MRSDILVPAAQYLRMSTEHQKYSMENQSAAIQEYASQRGFEVTHTYKDAGSGLELKRRSGLRELLHDAVQGTAYKVILVYDVSRWGRFLDVDESAHYEFICKSAGVPVHYCAETFENDGSLPSTVVKSLKRMMAGEYIRELSARVYEGSKRMSQRGFSTGGAAGYGLRRMLVSPAYEHKHELRFGERKNIQEDRIVYVHGSDEEVGCVREIFRMFTADLQTPGKIARELNRRGISYSGYKHRRWNFNAVDRILKNPKYAGCSVYGKSTGRLGMPRTKIPPQFWTRTPGVWTPIIDMATFKLAERRFASQPRNKTDDQLLDELRAVMHKNGELTGSLLRSSYDCPPHRSYVRRFGSLTEAFALAGYEGPGLATTKTRRRLRGLRDCLLQQIVMLDQCNVSATQEPRGMPSRLQLRNSEVVDLRLCCSYRVKNGDLRWSLQPRSDERDSTTLIARLNAENDGFHDLYVITNIPRLSHWRILPTDPWLEKGEKLNALEHFAETVHRVTALSSGDLF
jgi:DNA invertase Pin-like site-specific DNA recombinase